MQEEGEGAASDGNAVERVANSLRVDVTGLVSGAFLPNWTQAGFRRETSPVGHCLSEQPRAFRRPRVHALPGDASDTRWSPQVRARQVDPDLIPELAAGRPYNGCRPTCCAGTVSMADPAWESGFSGSDAQDRLGDQRLHDLDLGPVPGERLRVSDRQRGGFICQRLAGRLAFQQRLDRMARAAARARPRRARPWRRGTGRLPSSHGKRRRRSESRWRCGCGT